MPSLTIKGNDTGSTSNPLDLTVAQVNAILPIFTSTLNGLTPFSGGGNTNFLRADGSWAIPPGAGSVTSVGLGDASSSPIYNITNSPVTTSGTLTLTLKTQSANTIFAGPTTGAAAQPGFRALVGADLPNPSATTLGGIESYAAVTNQFINTISILGVPSSAQPAFTNISGTATIAQGGTGQTTAGAAFSALSPITTTGDLIYSSSGTTSSRLAIGSTGNVLTVAGGVPTWAAPATSGTVTSVQVSGGTTGLTYSGGPITSSGTITMAGTLAIANGGTGATSKAAAFDALSPMTTGGDLIYGGASGTGTRLANGTAGQFLQSNGTTLAPTWVTSASGTATPTANTVSKWDASVNMSANSFIKGYTTTATAAGTTTLTVTSTQQQVFTGTSTQTVVLPVTSTLVLGQSFTIYNNSTGVVTVQSSGANNIQILAGGDYAIFICILTSGTTSASWTSPATESVNMYANSGTTSITNGALTTLVYSTVTYDTHSAYNNSTGVYTIPVAGKYLIIGKFGVSAVTSATAAGADVAIRVHINGTVMNQQFVYAQTTTAIRPDPFIVVELKLSVNDTVAIAIDNGWGATLTMNNSALACWFNISRIGS